MVAAVTLLVFCANGNEKSAVGDPGMKRDALRVAFEAWNFCNEVGHEAPAMGSPRAADCFDLIPTTSSTNIMKHFPFPEKYYYTSRFESFNILVPVRSICQLSLVRVISFHDNWQYTMHMQVKQKAQKEIDQDQEGRLLLKYSTK